MSHLFTEINKLLIEGKSRVEIFTYRPENVDREALGSLFVLGEIFIRGRPEANDLFVLNAMASVLKREYYTTPYDTPAVNLEEALKAVNAAFPQISASTSPVEVQALVAVLNNDVLHIARHGHPEAFLVARNAGLISPAIKTAPPPRPAVKDAFCLIISLAARFRPATQLS